MAKTLKIFSVMMMLIVSTASAANAISSSNKELSAELSYELWDGFNGTGWGNDTRFGNVLISCKRIDATSPFNCFGAYRENNYTGYLKSDNLKTIIPELIPLSQDGLSASGNLRVLCKKSSAQVICKTTEEAWPLPTSDYYEKDSAVVVCRFEDSPLPQFVSVKLGDLRSSLQNRGEQFESISEFNIVTGDSVHWRIQIVYSEKVGYFNLIKVYTKAYTPSELEYIKKLYGGSLDQKTIERYIGGKYLSNSDGSWGWIKPVNGSAKKWLEWSNIYNNNIENYYLDFRGFAPRDFWGVASGEAAAKAGFSCNLLSEEAFNKLTQLLNSPEKFDKKFHL